MKPSRGLVPEADRTEKGDFETQRRQQLLGGDYGSIVLIPARRQQNVWELGTGHHEKEDS